MARVVSATQAKVRFGEILSDVSVGKNYVTIQRNGKPLATIIPQDDFEEFLRLKSSERRMSRREIIESINEWRESLPPPDPDAPDAVQIIREIRQHDRFK